MKKVKESKRDWNKILLIALLVLLLFEVVLIPCLIYAEVKRALSIIAFLLIPTLFGIAIILLSRNCIMDFQRKKNKLKK